MVAQAVVLRSMTGFGAGSSEQDGIHVTVELRSVNHRYLKLLSRLPEELAWSQERIDTYLRRQFRRGSIGCSVSLQLASQAASREIDADLLRKLYEQANAVGAQVGASAVSLGELLQVEGVVRQKETGEQDRDNIEAALDDALAKASAAMVEMQGREGELLAAELHRIVDSLSDHLAAIEQVLPSLATAQRDRYRQRIQDYLRDTGVDVTHADLLREVAIQSERADITEEIGRLRAHVAQYRELLEKGPEVGRKLDFLTQEMLREANTMASKVNEAGVARQIVDAKADIERLREQSQNVE